MPFKFEKLEVWKESVQLNRLIHTVSKKFPKAELYVLTSQIKRAADWLYFPCKESWNYF